jgi:hypothetical protein
MRKKIFTMLLSLLAFGLVNAQTVVFDPSLYAEGAFQGSDAMTIVEIDGQNYLKVELAAWESTFQVSSTVLSDDLNVFTAVAKFEEGSSGFLLEKVNTFIKLIDNTASDFAEVGITAAASSAEFIDYKGDITLAGATVTNIQVAGQETTDWSAVSGDFLYLGKVTAIAFDKNTLFDPAKVDPATLPEGMEIVEEDGQKLLKVKVNGWNSNLAITPFEVGDNNKMTLSVKYAEGTSGFDGSIIQTFVQAGAKDGSTFSASINPSPAELTEIITDARPNTVVNNLQIAAQQTSGDWVAISDAFVYVSKITVSYAEAQMAVAPNTTEVAFSAEAADITIDGLYDDAYGEVANAIARVAANETGGDISETNSSGEWLAVGDLENFYIFIEVNDDDPIALGTSTTPWMNDGVELFMDIQNRRYIGGKRIAGEQHQMRINYGTEGPAKGDFGMETFFGDSDTTNIEFAVVSSSSGYVIEARIPWATWYRTNTTNGQDALDAISLMENMKIAFEVSILDADALDGRKSILNWANNTGTDVAYQLNEYYGEITLKGGWPVAINSKVERASLSVYPNPANNQINVVMDKAAIVDIYNVVGAKVLNSKLNGSAHVDVSELNQGVYIIKVIDVNGKSAVTKFNKK